MRDAGQRIAGTREHHAARWHQQDLARTNRGGALDAIGGGERGRADAVASGDLRQVLALVYGVLAVGAHARASQQQQRAAGASEPAREPAPRWPIALVGWSPRLHTNTNTRHLA